MSDYKYKIGQRVRIRDDAEFKITAARRYKGKSGVISARYGSSSSRDGNYYTLVEVDGASKNYHTDGIYEFELAPFCKLNRDEGK